MSKQYLTADVIEEAHSAEIFGIAVTPKYILTASGDSSIKVWGAGSSEYNMVHEFSGVHKLGSHHVATSRNGKVGASVGFGGETMVWDLDNLQMLCEIGGKGKLGTENEGAWAVALAPQGDKLACSTCDGKVNIWDLSTPQEMTHQYVTKGSFGMCVDISNDGNLVASGHENGGIYIFNNSTQRIHHSLHGLVKSVRSVKFSPGGKLLAAGGDSSSIALFDVISGEQVANLAEQHLSWIFTVSWNSTGEYLLTGEFAGKSKVWSVDTRACVATNRESGAPVHAAQWIPNSSGVGEGFVTSEGHGKLCFYRETSGE